MKAYIILEVDELRQRDVDLLLRALATAKLPAGRLGAVSITTNDVAVAAITEALTVNAEYVEVKR